MSRKNVVVYRKKYLQNLHFKLKMQQKLMDFTSIQLPILPMFTPATARTTKTTTIEFVNSNFKYKHQMQCSAM